MAPRRRNRLFALFALLCSVCPVCQVTSFSVVFHQVESISRAQGKASYRTCTSIFSTKDQQAPPQSQPADGIPRVRRIPQVRQKPKNRKPRNFWLEVDNVETELRDLWKSVGVELVDDSQPPPIPNESLLNYWRRYDLRAAIVTHGGREALAESLGGALIIPGRWSVAVNTTYVQQLLENDLDLSSDLPPLSPQQLKKGIVREEKALFERKDKRQAAKGVRRGKGYWYSDQKVIQELFEYLEVRLATQHTPAVWMPRLSELTRAGRDDLWNAIRRYGGAKLICRKAGLVPFREWNYFEGMYDLMLELKSYLDEYHGGDYSVFPVVSKMNERGYERLHSLIQYFGGRKFLASRLDMECSTVRKKRAKKDLEQADMNWGSFDLDFGIDLLAFVRNENMKKMPPLRYPAIEMPSPRKLLASGEKGEYLHRKIEEYGGYENVARRLGLAFFVRQR